MSFTGLIVLYLLGISGVAALVVLVWVMRWRSRRRPVRNPLTRDLLRSPGHSLRQAIDHLNVEIQADAAAMMLVFWVVPAMGVVAGQRTQSWALAYGLTAVVFVAALVYLALRLWANFSRRENLRLGLDAELATGEELNRLMLRGCRVFHDVPAEGFNIDHVVVGPVGVFAVETKAKPKPRRRQSPQDWTVHYDGQVLRFPGGADRRALEQAKRQARWLGAWLSSATGEPVQIHAALALPGWWVERQAAGDVTVFNPKNIKFLAEVRNGREMPAAQIERIAHQLEQRCRDVVPEGLRRESAAHHVQT